MAAAGPWETTKNTKMECHKGVVTKCHMIILVIERVLGVRFFLASRGRASRVAASLAAVAAGSYLLTAFQSQKPSRASSTQGTSALNTSKTSTTTTADQAERLTKAFASSVMKRQRGSSGIDGEGLVPRKGPLVS